ncbi:ankyrin repeat protein [Colletotrichum costaricense]|uniref:Ankyrin repeat protein n=1 Tax=Colletotrichum costaricense TaxID=1209916 RepID=A0AAI9YGX7_9PEZI|nr:ankyrin repeat protein [Colletotrichum costaricense]KAK1509212.1 ankyrin repeat protein [Colletotrichum costaricense]
MGLRSRVSALFKSNKSSPENNDTHPDAGTDFQTSSPHPEDTAGTTEDDLRSNLNASSRRDIDSTRDLGRRIAQAAARKQDCYGLKILVPQPSDRTGCVDIVAIHGLNGHREETWMHADTRLQWLSDSSCLPKDMPTARILTFGYNSKTYFSRSESEIPDFASELLWALKAQRTSEEEKQRRIVFICHSLGGLVFKQAVIMAHEQRRHYSCILDHICGVVFFGTPHRGSSLAAWDEIGTLIVKASTLGYTTNSKLSSSLKVDSKFLRRISESFAARGDNFEVRSFYENLRMKGLNCKVVEKESAILNWPKELHIASNANHSAICKFPSPEDSRYKAASLAIREAVGTLGSRSDVRFDLPAAIDCVRELNSEYEYHLDQIDDPIPKTCEWVTSHEIWTLWDSVPGSALLWISADAGCGKSVVAKYLVDFFQKRTFSAHLHTHVCYFFFKEGLENQDNASSAVSAVLHQLLSKQSRVMHHALAKYLSMPKSSFNRFPTLWSILLATMDDVNTKRMVFILDGLDECEEKSLDELVKALADFFQSRKELTVESRPACKIVLLSRPLNSVERRFGLRSGNGNLNIVSQYSKNGCSFRLSAEEESVSVAKDIAQFVISKVSDLGQQSELSTEILDRLKKRLISNADYTFLWVSLVLNIVKEAEVDGISMDQIEAILATTKLEDVYEKLLSGRASPLKTRKVLLLILAAVRPLTLDELCGAVEVNQDHHQQPDTKESKRALNHSELRLSAEQLGQQKVSELETFQKPGTARATMVLSSNSSSSAVRPVKESTKRRVITRNGSIMGSTNLTPKLTNIERRGMTAASLWPEANHTIINRQPATQMRTVSNLQELQSFVHRPFVNHLRQICGHFVRIRNQKIYLVHQTARQFLLDRDSELDFKMVFRWKRHSLATDQDRQKSGSLELVSQWQHSISLADANMYMLQLCADYINLIQLAEPFNETILDHHEASVYLKECRNNPHRAFLRYVSRHWLDHYRPVREDLERSYDYLLQPNTSHFNAWIISHVSWVPEEQRRGLEASGLSYQTGPGRVELRQDDANAGPSEKKERELQAALQHFNLMGNESDLYDEEYIHGKRYWKAKDYMDSGDASTSDEDEELDKHLKESKATIPDRMQYYRQQQSQRVVESIDEGRRATSASMANPTSSRSWLT